MEQCIRQNNAVDIYEDYFETVDDSTQCEKPEAKTVHVFRDPTATQYKRPVSAVSWCPDGGTKIAIAYCNLEFQATHPDTTKESYCFKVGELLSSYIHAILILENNFANCMTQHANKTERGKMIQNCTRVLLNQSLFTLLHDTHLSHVHTYTIKSDTDSKLM